MSEDRFDVGHADLLFVHHGMDPRNGELTGCVLVKPPAGRQVHMGLSRPMVYADLTLAALDGLVSRGEVPAAKYAALKRVHDLASGIGPGLDAGERARLLATLKT